MSFKGKAMLSFIILVSAHHAWAIPCFFSTSKPTI
ncbi:hypothetical protein NEOC65_001812 [Neochlamydia sp. AcF65]|nr:hypothetical protein [Neochlamydia sp. AcF65]MBS4171490.1 hypothetical protein [Neochlamydia sp. AcF95]